MLTKSNYVRGEGWLKTRHELFLSYLSFILVLMMKKQIMHQQLCVILVIIVSLCVSDY